MKTQIIRITDVSYILVFEGKSYAIIAGVKINLTQDQAQLLREAFLTEVPFIQFTS